jgi:DNA uptake protein ComE-like DNA-binding protein
MIERTAARQLFLGTLFCFATTMSAVADGILDANTASREELIGLAQLDQSLVESILAHRPYETIGALHELLSRSLDAETLEALYANLFVPLKLNSASDSDIQLIPGVGRKMAHEFEEYRPYTSIEQFRREIGKYVDEQEVARLEQYVTLE